MHTLNRLKNNKLIKFVDQLQIQEFKFIWRWENNKVPDSLRDILEEKNRIAAQQSLANYSFFLGVNGDNIDEVIQTDTSKILGVSDDGLYFTKKGNFFKYFLNKVLKFSYC